MYCWIWFATFLLRSFVSMFISDIGLLTFFSCFSGLVSGWWCLHLMSLGLFLPLQFFWKNFRRISVLLLLFSHQIMSDSLWPHRLKPIRLLCTSLSPGVCPSSRLLNQWCLPTISSSVALFSCFQSVPASRSFLVSQLFISGGQSIGASASVLPMSIQGWFPLRLAGLISFLSRGLSKVFARTTVWKHQFFRTLCSLWSSSHIHTWLLERL